jgi:hypothetical protein
LDLEFSSLSFRFRGSADCDFSAASPFPDEDEEGGIGSDGSTDCALDESEAGCFGGRPLEAVGLDAADLILEMSEASGPL